MSYEARLGMEIKSDHPNAYNSGIWGTIIALDSLREDPETWTYLVAWPSGDTDVWPCEDSGAAYEFRAKVSA